MDYRMNRNLDSSSLTLRRQARTAYANHIALQRSLQQGCTPGIFRTSNGIGGFSGGDLTEQFIEGETATTSNEVSAILTSANCPGFTTTSGSNVPPPPGPGIGGSFFYNGSNATTGIYVDNTANILMSNGDFTIEWFQYSTGGAFSRGFSIGSYGGGNNDQAVSFEGVIYYWQNGSPLFTGTTYITQNQWQHLALSRNSDVLYMYLDGQCIGSNATSYNYNSSQPLAIGNESVPNADAEFIGYITNFRMVKGNAIYPNGTAFTVPTAPLTAVTGTTLLLTATDSGTAFNDGSGLGNTITPSNIVWASNNPF
jgi:hypothetical protein